MLVLDGRCTGGCSRTHLCTGVPAPEPPPNRRSSRAAPQQSSSTTAEQQKSRRAAQQQSSSTVSSLQHQNQSVLPALLLLYINCHRSCGNIFTQFNSYSHETNLQICATRSICHPSLEFTNIQNGTFHDEMAASNGRYIIHRCNGTSGTGDLAVSRLTAFLARGGRAKFSTGKVVMFFHFLWLASWHWSLWHLGRHQGGSSMVPTFSTSYLRLLKTHLILPNIVFVFVFLSVFLSVCNTNSGCICICVCICIFQTPLQQTCPSSSSSHLSTNCNFPSLPTISTRSSLKYHHGTTIKDHFLGVPRKVHH